MQFRCCLQSSCIWKLMNYEISGLINCNQNLRLFSAAETDWNSSWRPGWFFLFFGQSASDHQLQSLEKIPFGKTRSVRAQLGTGVLVHNPRLVCELLNVEDSAAAPRVAANYSTQCSCHSSSSNCTRIFFLCFTETQIRFVEQPTPWAGSSRRRRLRKMHKRL
jgi:hypothetical protein